MNVNYCQIFTWYIVDFGTTKTFSSFKAKHGEPIQLSFNLFTSIHCQSYLESKKPIFQWKPQKNSSFLNKTKNNVWIENISRHKTNKKIDFVAWMSQRCVYVITVEAHETKPEQK